MCSLITLTEQQGLTDNRDIKKMGRENRRHTTFKDELGNLDRQKKEIKTLYNRESTNEVLLVSVCLACTRP